MNLSVVVGTFNRQKQLQECIESIFSQTKVPVRVYVADAGSTDGTIEYLNSITSNRLFPIFAGKRLGQARAYNEVFQLIETPYVCWLSDDNVIVNHGLDVATRILDNNPKFGMVGLKVKDVVGPFVEAPYVGGISSIGILNVNQGLLRNSILKEVGGFSEAFRDYGIDPDLTAKVIFSGYQVVYTRTISIHHYRNWGNNKQSSEYTDQMEKQRVYKDLYFRKYSSFLGRGVGWKLKKWMWRVLAKIFPVSKEFNSKEPFMGLLIRDYYNIFTSRYISLFDPFRYYDKDYYLVQYCPKKQRSHYLPKDSVKPKQLSSPADKLIQTYLKGGQIPWSPGYGEYRLQYVTRVLEDDSLLRSFNKGLDLPSRYGARLDERVVEYPWVFSRSRDWGVRILDAGSTLNYPIFFSHPVLRNRDIIIYNLAHDWIGKEPNVRYITGDLRNMSLRDNSVDVVVCISTLEHIGLDNTMLYTDDPRFQEVQTAGYHQVLLEFRRVLVPGGRLLLTVPFGGASNFGWMQQFDSAGIEEICATFGVQPMGVSFYRYFSNEWIVSNSNDCASCEYFDVHSTKTSPPDGVVAARAVACLEFINPK